MGPTYATGDPMALNYSGDGLVVEVGRDDAIGEYVPIPHPQMIVSNPGNPRRMARMHGYRGYGQMETGALPEVYASEDALMMPQPSGPGLLDSIGNALSGIIRTIGQQAPGIITGQPTAGQIYPGTYAPPSPLGGISPLLLIGGGLLVWYMMSGKRR